jgi:hypothetical protein
MPVSQLTVLIAGFKRYGSKSIIAEIGLLWSIQD